MPRQTSLQLTEATERQVKVLRSKGYGTLTDIFRIAVDRMYREEIPMFYAISTLNDSAMNEQQILQAAHARGKADAAGRHPGPDQADIADLSAQLRTARGVVDFGDELGIDGEEIDTSDWTEADWDAWRQADKAIYKAVGDAYAAGADEGRSQ